MKRMRGLVALAGLLALAGCEDENGCPGIGEHSGGIVNVQITRVVSSDCVVDATTDELVLGLITVPASSCPLVEPSYQDAQMCDYAMRSVCQDSEFGWGFNARVYYVGEGQYEGTARFARSDLDGNVICSAEYELAYYNITE